MNNSEVPKSKDTTAIAKQSAPVSSQVVAAESVQAEDVPTIPLDSLQTLSTLQPEVSVHAVDAVPHATLPEPLVVQPAEYRRGPGEWARIWWDGIRPGYLWFALLPLALGTVLGWLDSLAPHRPLGEFHPQRFVAALLAVCLLQIGANLLNDYYDYLGGTDTSNALGPGGLIQQGLIKPARVLAIGLFLLIVGALVGGLAAFSAGWIALALGALGVLGAYFYSMPRRGLSRITLGEIAGFWLYGPALTLGAYALQRGKVDTLPLIYSISPGLLIMAALYINNMRDIESDAQSHKYTVASLLGIRSNRLLVTLIFLGAYVPVLVLGIPSQGPHLLLITLWTLPGLVALLIALYRTVTPASLHTTMHRVISLTILFTILLIVAVVISTYITEWHTFALPALPTVL